MYLTRELTSLSLAQIARAFERDHSTVLHAVRSVSKRLDPGSDLSEMLDRMRGLIQNGSDLSRSTAGAIHHSGSSPHGQSTAPPRISSP
jgi:hypothetical protein